MMNKLIAKWRWILIVVIVTGIGLAAMSFSVKSATPIEPTGMQDIINLNQRVNSLEQRLFTIESSIRRLEQQQQTAVPSASTPTQPARDPEVERLRSQVETLTIRIRELECGLVQVDERTLSASTKEARKHTGADVKDPCRLNAESPVKLSMRQ